MGERDVLEKNFKFFFKDERVGLEITPPPHLSRIGIVPLGFTHPKILLN